MAGKRSGGPAHAASTPLDRRTFLRRTAVGLGLTAGVGALVTAEHWWPGSGPQVPVSGGGAPRPVHPVAQTSVDAPNGMAMPTADWVIAENSRPGSLDWLVAGHQVEHGIEGYADRVSGVAGDTVTLYVNTTAPSFHVEAYRLGWYQGLVGRQVWISTEVPGAQQPLPGLTAGTNMVECAWKPSISFEVGDWWPPGVYVLKLVGSGGQQQFVPFTLRDDASTASYMVQNSVTTWQAYNLWGGYSLYYGKSGSGRSYATRSRVVSFDRPYQLTWANGAADLIGNELPLIILLERMGLDVTYTTDIDLHQEPQRVLRHHAMLSLGHDEYWSPKMRSGATSARDAGVNLVFFGANACYRRIRLEDSPTGTDRRQVCYKDASEDPLSATDPAQSTANWPDPPAASPESSLIGDMYQSNPVNADLVVTDASSFMFAGSGLQNGAAIPGLVGSEYDRYDPTVPSPSNTQVLAHSPLVCRGRHDFSDVTWYTAPSGAGVLATGSNWWISKLSNAPQLPSNLLPGPFPASLTTTVSTLTQNILGAVGKGPAGQRAAAQANWSQYYSAGGAGYAQWQTTQKA